MLLAVFGVPPLMSILRPEDASGHTIAIDFFAFLVPVAGALTALVVHHLRLAQRPYASGTDLARGSRLLLNRGAVVL